MNDFQRKREILAQTAYPCWTDARARAVRLAANHAFLRTRRFKSKGWLWGASFAFITATAAGVMLLASRSANSPQEERLLTFSDGARALLLDERADVSVRAGSGLPSVEVASGRVQFLVEPHARRPFRVISQSILVEVMSANFIVESLAAGTRVSVQAGQAEVRWAKESVTLSAGTSGVFPPAESPPAMQTNPTPPPADSPQVEAAPVLNATPRQWRRLAQRGRYRAAFEALQNLGASAVRDEPADLLLSADVARLSGHARQAVAPLERLIAKYPNDARAPAAAFTLGKLLVEQLNAVERGAQRFAQARKLAPHGPLSQAALAREAEALWRADRRGDALERIDAYESMFPHGPHLEGLRLLRQSP